MVAIWIGLVFLGIILVLVLPALFGWDVHTRFRGERDVLCPETQAPVKVRVNTRHAVSTALNGHMRLRLSSCTRWPTRAGCDQDCIAQIPSERPLALAVFDGIHYAAVFTAAGLGWLLAMIWYAEPVFGSAYLQAQGISREAARVNAERILPYLGILAANLLVAYAVAWILRRKDWHGAAAGMEAGTVIAVLLIALSLATTLAGHQPWTALWINAGYLLVTCLLLGAIVGGWERLAKEVE